MGGGKILWRQEGTHGKAGGKILWRQDEEGTHGKTRGKILWIQDEEGTHGKARGKILWRQDEEGTHGKARGAVSLLVGTLPLLWGGSREDGVITSGCRCQFVIRSTTGPTMNQFCTSQ